MASLEKQKGLWRIVFRYGGKKFQRALATGNEKEAKAMKARVEENLELLTRGRLSYSPESDDLVTILLSDGRLNSLPAAQKATTVGTLLKDYRSQVQVGKEQNTRYTERIHIKHLLRIARSVVPPNWIAVAVRHRIEEVLRIQFGVRLEAKEFPETAPRYPRLLPSTILGFGAFVFGNGKLTVPNAG